MERSLDKSQNVGTLQTSLIRATALAVTFVIAMGFTMATRGSAAEVAHAIPTPATDVDAAGATSETAVLAGGCFWGVQGVFQHVNGVTNAVSGYTGGEKSAAPVMRSRSGSPSTRAKSATGDPPDLFLGGARSDPAQPPGTGRGHPVSLRDFPGER
jgi:peptide-methionine (S)-S-oxide reductase